MAGKDDKGSWMFSWGQHYTYIDLLVVTGGSLTVVPITRYPFGALFLPLLAIGILRCFRAGYYTKFYYYCN